MSPRPKLKVEQWVAHARRGLLELIEQEDAVIWDEVEAKLADRQWPTLPSPIDPHHLSTARHQLVSDGVLAEHEEATRGGRPIGVLHLAELHRRKTAYERAASRKRLLQARYQRWGFGDKSTAALLGPSGERVVRESLKVAAGQAGLRPIANDFGQVRKLLGVDLPGSFDSGVFMPSVDEDGIPGPTIAVPIEVKNRRTWVYPNSDQLYQLLYKAALVQTEHPEAAIVPVLICRRFHITTQWMAAEMGFFVVAAKQQYVQWPADDDKRLLEEVRSELGYDDLIDHHGPSAEVVGYLARGLPKIALRSVDRWKRFGPPLIEVFKILRREVAQPSRAVVMESLRAGVRQLGGEARW